MSYNFDKVGIRYANSAFRHGISRERIEYVVDHCGLVFDEAAPADSRIPDDRSVFLGDDANGVALEVAGIELDSGDLLIIHAMKLRAKYRPRVGGGTCSQEGAMKTKSGRVLTAADIEALAAEAERGYDLTKAKRRRVGRPSLGRGTSPRVQFRLEAELYKKAQAKAAVDGRSLSAVGRELFERYVADSTKKRRKRRRARAAR